MALKGTLSDINEVAEPLREHYKKEGEVWVLDSPDLAPRSKVNEFRDTNVAMQRRLDELSAQYAGVDAEEYRQFKTKAEKERDKKLIDAGKIEEMFAERLSPIKAEKERVEKELSAALEKKSAMLSKFMIDNQIQTAALKSGVRASAVPDMLLRGAQLFRINDDKVVAMNGDQPVFGKNGEPLGFEEWIGGLAESAPHLFETSQGGGAPKQGAHQSAAVGKDKVARADSVAFLNNIDAIASGKTKVV